MITELFSSISEFINSISGQNQVIAGAISLWLLTALSYLGKNIPQQVFSFLKKHSTTTLQLSNDSAVFYHFQQWLNNNGLPLKTRTIRINNGRWGYDKMIKSIGYGKHVIWYKYRPLIINYSEKNSDSDKIKESISLTKFGRNHSLLQEIIDDLNNLEKDTTQISLYENDKKNWIPLGTRPKRSFDSIFLNKNEKKLLLDTVNNFINRESFYIKNGIPYQLGILLHGLPGTGKTSLIKALASIYDKDIYKVSSLDTTDLGVVFNNTPANSIIVIEDIDCFDITKKRQKTVEKDNQLKLSSLVSNNLSDLLNSIDGLMSSHGRILLATTNNIDKLDDALIREGRFDLKLEIKPLEQDSILEFIESFYNQKININYNLKPVTGSYLQGLMLKNKDPYKVLEILKNEL